MPRRPSSGSNATEHPGEIVTFENACCGHACTQRQEGTTVLLNTLIVCPALHANEVSSSPWSDPLSFVPGGRCKLCPVTIQIRHMSKYHTFPLSNHPVIASHPKHFARMSARPYPPQYQRLCQQSQQLLDVLLHRTYMRNLSLHLPRAVELPLPSPISPTTHTRSVSPTCRDAQTVTAPLSTVISLADAIPSLRREDQENTSPNTGSPASHSLRSSTAIPARYTTSCLDPLFTPCNSLTRRHTRNRPP